MKINIDMDLTPEEARRLMGLPDLEPMQKEMMKKVQDKMNQAIDNMQDPEYLMKQYMPVGMQGFEQVQKFMTDMAQATMSATTPKKDKSDKDTKK